MTSIWTARQPRSLSRWLETHNDPPVFPDSSLDGLDGGEKAPIALAISLSANLLLIDDRAGVAVARGKGLRVTGTPGIVDLAAERGLLDFTEAIRSQPTPVQLVLR